MASKSNFSVVIDIGTSKIAALAGQNNEDGKLEILGMEMIPSRGVKRGIIYNIEEAAASVRQLVGKLEQQTGRKIKTVEVTFATQQIKINEYTGYRYTSDEGVVTATDIGELYNEAKNLKVDQDYKILHVIPQSYTIDDEITGQNPVGIAGRKIESRYKILAVPENHLINLKRTFDKAGLETGGICLSVIALGETILTEEEKDVGAILLDIGAGATKLGIYFDGVLTHAAVIPFGGNVITADIKEGCSIHPRWAEQLKVRYGEALGDFADEQKVVTIPGHNGWEPKEISFKSLAFIIQARLEEIIDSVNYQIAKTGIEGQLGSGIVVTGGTAELTNMISLIKFRTGLDARMAFPVIHPVNKLKEIKNPGYFTAFGLLKMSLENEDVPAKEKRKKPKRKKEGGVFAPWLKNVVQGVLDYVDDDEDLEMK